MTADHHPLELTFHIPTVEEEAAARKGLDRAEDIWEGEAASDGLVLAAETAAQQVMRIISAGYAVAIEPHPRTVTVEQAAAMLGVPLVELGIPSTFELGVVALEDVVARRDELRAAAAPAPSGVTGEYPEPRGPINAQVGPWRVRIAGQGWLSIVYLGDRVTDVELQVTIDGVPEPPSRFPEVRPKFAFQVITPAPARASRRMVEHLRERSAAGYRTYAVEVTVHVQLSASWVDLDGARHHDSGAFDLWIEPDLDVRDENDDVLRSWPFERLGGTS